MSFAASFSEFVVDPRIPAGTVAEKTAKILYARTLKFLRGEKRKKSEKKDERKRERERRKWAAKGRAQRLYRLLIVRLWSIILSENGHFHVEGSNYARFSGYYYIGEGLYRRSGRGPRNRGALLKASPTDRAVRALDRDWFIKY